MPLTPFPPQDAGPVPEHDCEAHWAYTFGPLGWGWYCPVCGSFAPADDIPEG